MNKKEKTKYSKNTTKEIKSNKAKGSKSNTGNHSLARSPVPSWNAIKAKKRSFEKIKSNHDIDTEKINKAFLSRETSCYLYELAKKPIKSSRKILSSA